MISHESAARVWKESAVDVGSLHADFASWTQAAHRLPLGYIGNSTPVSADSTTASRLLASVRMKSKLAS